MLSIRLCGPMAAELDGRPVGMPSSERARALVAWLALHPGRHARTVVAAQLWPDASSDGARANLRTATWAVRTAWGPAADHLLADRTTLELADVTVDAREPATTAGDPNAGGELLPGLDDEWVLTARAALLERHTDRLRQRADRADAAGDPTEAVRWSRRLAELRPLDEEAHRALMERLLRAGERAAAVVTAREFADRLREEVGVRPSPATRAVHAQARTEGGSAPRSPVFGRSAEVGWLLERWREAAVGHGQVVVVRGEAGIGKTTLLAELAHRVGAAGGRTAVAAGFDVAGETPFAAWLDLARGLASSVRPVPEAATWPAELNRLSPSLGARLGHPEQPPVATAPELERLRVFEASLRLVEWGCAERPTLLVIDDAHRADRASLRIAGYVGRRLATLPALLVLVRRDGVRRPELDGLLADLAGRGIRTETLHVPPISDVEVGALARSLDPQAAAHVDRVVAVAEGNPLLAVEAARALVAGSTGPPANLRAAVTATLGRLDDSTVGVVELLAAAGRPLQPEELRRLGVPVATDLVSASEGLVVRRDGRLGYRHELLRSAVYAGLPDPAGLHDRLADGIDPAEHVERAHHLSAAGRHTEAAAALAAAAVRARSMGALDEAAELLERAVVEQPTDGGLWLELEEAYAWAHRREDLETAWTQVLRLLTDEALPEAWCRRGRQFRTVTCHPEEALRAYRTAARLATPATDAAVRADALIGLAWCDAVVGSGEECERLLAEARGLMELGPLSRADALEIQQQGLIRQARFAEAAALVADPEDPEVRLVESIPDRAYSALVNAACALVCIGEDEQALGLVERALRATSGVKGLATKMVAARAQLLARLGRHDEAMADATLVQAWADGLDDATLAATATHDRGLLAMATGRYAEAADLLAQAVAAGASVSRVTAGLTRAEALALAGDADAATAQLRASLLEPVGRADQAWALVPRVALVQGLVARARGDMTLARRRLEESAAAWRRVAATAAADAGEGYLASLVDLGRPPIVGLVEPARELDRIAALVAALDPEPAAR